MDYSRSSEEQTNAESKMESLPSMSKTQTCFNFWVRTVRRALIMLKIKCSKWSFSLWQAKNWVVNLQVHFLYFGNFLWLIFPFRTYFFGEITIISDNRLRYESFEGKEEMIKWLIIESSEEKRLITVSFLQMTILMNSIKRTQRLIKRWSSLNQSEVDKFAAMSSDWWDQVKMHLNGYSAV